MEGNGRETKKSRLSQTPKVAHLSPGRHLLSDALNVNSYSTPGCAPRFCVRPRNVISPLTAPKANAQTQTMSPMSRRQSPFDHPGPSFLPEALEGHSQRRSGEFQSHARFVPYSSARTFESSPRKNLKHTLKSPSYCAGAALTDKMARWALRRCGAAR